MPNVNKVHLIGNMCRDVELRYTQGGTAFGRFTLAVNRVYSKDGKKSETAAFIDCVVWAKQAETLNSYVKKGVPLYVEGRLVSRTWEKDGRKQSKLEVHVENFQFLGAPPNVNATNRHPKADVPTEELNTDDIPF